MDSFAPFFAAADRQESRRSLFSHIIWPSLGILGLVLCGVIIIAKPYPTYFQSEIAWYILSVVITLSLVGISGNVEFKYSSGIKATGSIAIFVILIFNKPSSFSGGFERPINQHLTVYLARKDSLKTERYVLQVTKVTDTLMHFIPIELTKYLGDSSIIKDTFSYWTADGLVSSNQLCKNFPSEGVIAISNSVGRLFETRYLAYLNFRSILR
jgi:hypothetical protein